MYYSVTCCLIHLLLFPTSSHQLLGQTVPFDILTHLLQTEDHLTALYNCSPSCYIQKRQTFQKLINC